MAISHVAASAFVAACTVAQIAVAAPSKCIPDGSVVTVSGVFKLHHNRDRATGEPYTYVVLETGSSYCLSGPHVDAQSKKPTSTILMSEPSSEARRYLDRLVVVHGRLAATNMGGPVIFYDEIKPE